VYSNGIEAVLKSYSGIRLFNKETGSFLIDSREFPIRKMKIPVREIAKRTHLGFKGSVRPQRVDCQVWGKK
jgi:hypothetical protein